MLFNSIKYAIFLPIVIVIYFLLPEHKKNNNSENNNKEINQNRYRNFFLLIASYFFYMCWIPKYALLIMFSTIATYITASMVDKIEENKKRKIALAVSIVINFAILFVFKYYNFFATNINNVLLKIGININFNKFNLLLPVGISFYTFQAVGYVIDVYRKDIKHEKNFINYALFVSFFPQLVAGPIERAKNLLPQFRESHKFNYSNAVNGMKIILIGLFKKVVIADTIAIYIDAVFNNVTAYTGLTLIIAVILFSIQIYCDFSGYSDIAIGSAKILDFRLMENFNAPYLSSSVGEFWNRWHISLNTWFKDYVYIPLGGSRKGFKRKCINLMIVFLLSGLWHGASWTFILWGMINGFYRICQEILKKKLKRIELNNQFLYKVKKIVKIFITYTLICFSWIFFRANSLSDAKYIILNLFNNIQIHQFLGDMSTIISVNLLDLSNVKYFYCIIVIISIITLFIIDLKKNKKQNMNYDKILFQNKYIVIRWMQYIILTILIMFLFMLQNGIYGQTGQFIYFQF